MLAAVKKGNLKQLAELIRQNPGFDVNEKDDSGWALLHHACNGPFSFSVIPLLLAHPEINVNLKDESGRTPFYVACCGRTSSARLLLQDSRVKVNESNRIGYTSLYWAAHFGSLDIVMWWIASEREMDLEKPGDEKTDAIGVARNESMIEVVTLLERFKANPEKTRHEVRLEVGWYDEAVAEMFALVVFVSDGLLKAKDATITPPAARFFNIARNLPLELQMVLCFRHVGSAKEIIQGKDSEAAFKELAKRFLWSSFFTG